MATDANDAHQEVCRSFRNTGVCPYGDECKFEHSKGDSIPNPPRGMCFQFKQEGECKFGDRCRFKHSLNDPRFDADGNRILAKKRKKVRTREKLDEVCNNYLAGRCRYGDSCRRQHPGDVPQEPVEKIDEVCRNHMEGKCLFGDMCRRIHAGS